MRIEIWRGAPTDASTSDPSLTDQGDPADPPHRWDRLVLAAGALIAFASGASWNRGITTDTVSVDASAWHLAKAGSLNLAGVAGGVPWLVHVPSGAAYSDRFPGAILAGVPAYLLGPEHLTQWPGTLTAVLLGVVSVLLLHSLVARMTGPRAARWVTAVAILASPLLSLVSDQLWAHAVSVPSILAAMVLAQRAFERRSMWLLLGSGAVLVPGILARPHVAAVSLCLGLGFTILWRRVMPLFAAGIPASAAVTAIWVYHRVLFAGAATSGDGLLVGSYTGRTGHLAATLSLGFVKNLMGGLFSVNRGVIVYAPWLLVALIALRPAWRAAPPWVRMFAASAPLFALIQLLGNGYQGGTAFFGVRVLVEPIALLVPLAVVAWPLSHPWLRRVLLALLPGYVLMYVVGSYYPFPVESSQFWAAWTPADLVWMAPWTVWALGGTAAALAAATSWPSWRDWTASGAAQPRTATTPQPSSSP